MATAILSDVFDAAEDALYEVVDGAVVAKNVSAFALWIANEMAHHLSTHCRLHGLGQVFVEMVFVLDAAGDLKRRPDLAFVSAAKWPVGRPPLPGGDWAIIPDLAVEIASPGNSFADLVRKVEEYFRFGVGEVWILVPEERVVYIYHTPRTANVLQANDTLTSNRLPGWTATVGQLIPEFPE